MFNQYILIQSLIDYLILNQLTTFFFDNINNLNPVISLGRTKNNYVTVEKDLYVLYAYLILACIDRSFKINNKICPPRTYFPMCWFGRRDPTTGKIFYEVMALILYTRCNSPRCDCLTYSEERDECFWNKDAESTYLK